jgi:predicted oxidoreductase (fatty acid repression mutant protein)
VNDLVAIDFFQDDQVVQDLYRFFDALRDQCPVSREPLHGVALVTGWQEAVDVDNRGLAALHLEFTPTTR